MPDEYMTRVVRVSKQVYLTGGESTLLHKLGARLRSASVSDTIRTVLRDRLKAEGLLS